MTPSPVRIFTVDDHALVREWLANLLRTQPGFAVTGEASEAPVALALMKADPPDIAIVDLSLRSGSGLDLIKDIRSHLPHTRIIVLSMHEELTLIERAFRAGASGYIMKREATTRVVEAVRAVSAGGIFADPAILGELTGRMLGRGTNLDRPAAEALSDRELEVFQRLGLGHSTRRIAEELGVGVKTVQEYQARIKEKLGLPDATQLLRAAVRWHEGLY